MTEPTNTSNENETQQTPSELDVLKERARLIGVEFSNNIGIDTLRERINAKLEGKTETQEEAKSEDQVNALTGKASSTKTPSLRQYLYNEQMKLIRIRIQCLDDKKKDLRGEIVTVANEHLGTVSKLIPFGEATENGYHVPYCIYKELKARKFLQIRTRKDARGNITVETGYVREFAIEVLDPLTDAELKELARAQEASGRLKDD